MKNSLIEVSSSYKLGEKIKYLRLAILVSLILGITYFWIQMGEHLELIFLTQLGKYLTVSYFLLVSIENFIQQARSRIFQQLIIIIYVSIISVEVLIIIFYWSILFPLEYKKFNNHVLIFNNLFDHLYVGLTLWIDNLFNLIQITRKQIVFPIGLALIYGIFNCCYTLTISNIYAPLKWDDLYTYFYVVVVVLILIIHHLFLSFYYTKYKEKHYFQLGSGNQLLQQIVPI